MKFRRSCTVALPSHSDLEIRVVDSSLGEDFGRIIGTVFGLPAAAAPWIGRLPGRDRWICVMAFDGPAPVAAGAAYVEGGFAWLGFGATLESCRRRGAQNALLARRLLEARELGAEIAVTETGERVPGRVSQSYRNILRAGFEEAYLRPNYLSPPVG